MPSRVVIALVGDPARPGDRIDEAEWAKPWSERPRIELDVADDETLASVVERALEAFGVAPDPHGVSPVHTVDLVLDGARELSRPISTVFALVDDDGRVVWNVHDLRFIPYGQLARSVEAGAVQGDPRSFYLILREPIGDGLGLDWETAFQAWLIIWLIIERIGAAGGAIQTVRDVVNMVRDRLGRGRAAVDRNVHRWAQRGALPPQFARFLDRDVWASNDLARLLGCSREDAEAVLALFGFAYDEATDLWRREGDQAARLLRAVYRQAEWTAADLTLSEDARRDFEARMEEMLRTGEPLPEPAYELEEEFDEELEFFELRSLTIAPEGIAGIGHMGGRDVQIQVPSERLRGEAARLFNQELIPLAYRVLAREVARLGGDVRSVSGESEADDED